VSVEYNFDYGDSPELSMLCARFRRSRSHRRRRGAVFLGESTTASTLQDLLPTASLAHDIRERARARTVGRSGARTATPVQQTQRFAEPAALKKKQAR